MQTGYCLKKFKGENCGRLMRKYNFYKQVFILQVIYLYIAFFMLACFIWVLATMTMILSKFL